MSDDPWEDPSAIAWAKHVVEDMAPKMAESAVSIMIATGGIGDVKLWVETGAALWMDKPLIVTVFRDAVLPKKIEQMADEIVRLPDGIDVAGSEELAAAINRVIARIEEKEHE